MAGARELKKNPKTKRKGPALAAAAVLVAAGAYLGLCAWAGGTGVMPNMTLGGLDVSGMSVEQVQDALEQAIETHGADASVTLTYGDWKGTITANQMQMFGEDNGLNAVKAGQGAFLTRGFRYISGMLGNDASDVALDMGYESIAQPALEALLDQAEQAIGCEVNQSEYRIEDDKLVMTKGKTGLSIDREHAKGMVYDAFQRDALPGAFAGTPCDAAVELVLTQNPAQTPDFEAIHSELCAPPVNAYMDPETHEIVPHVSSVQFEAAVLKNAYEKAAEGETFSIPVALTEPEETTESLKAKLFRDLLGEGTSTVGGTANRKHNVKLSAAACNNVILMPGEIFAYNETTGSRSADKGYLPAPIYVNGKSEDDVGGGICQTSSTIYYAVLHTTLEVVERHAHMYATGYVPDGMDATVYFGSLDFRFKNNTDYPIKIVTESYDKNGKRYLTAKIYGTNVDGRYAKPERVQFDWEEPTTTYVADETIPQGTTKVDSKQNPYTGRKAQTFRYVYEANGTLVEKQDMGVSKYKMRTRTVYYNPADGDPETWVNGEPPKPVAPEVPSVPQQPEQPAVQPEQPSVPQQPEQPTVQPEPAAPSEGQPLFPGGPVL